jgi:hypothetical protein
MIRILLVLVVLCAALGGAGYWNYQRNEHLDQDLQNRPYRTLKDRDLALLEQAYRDELASFTKKLQKQSQRLGGGDGKYAASDLQGKIEGFGKAQASAGRVRDTQLEVAERQVGVEHIEREKRIRAAGLDQEWNRIKRRLLTF